MPKPPFSLAIQTVFHPRTKKLFSWADFSAKNWFSVGLETILGMKNRNLKKIREKSEKIADFLEKSADFLEKSDIFPKKSDIF